MKAVHLLAPLVLAAASACAAPTRVSTQEAYKPSEVVRQSLALKGKNVMIRGYLVLEDESHGLWDSKEDVDGIMRRIALGQDPVWDHCITIYFDRKIGRTLRIPTRGNVEVTGTVDVTNREKDGVDLWACNDTYMDAHRLVRK
jgi:hypothetical protein